MKYLCLTTVIFYIIMFPQIETHESTANQARGDMKVWKMVILLDFSLTVKEATLIFISGCGWAISSAKKGKSGFIYNLV